MNYYYLDENLALNKVGSKKLKSVFYGSLIFNIVAIIAIILFLFFPPVIEKIKVQIVNQTIEVPEDIKLSDSAILHELVKQKCVLPSIALAQMKIETGHFTSAICKENKNIAGIRTSKSSYVVGMNRGHCVYKTYRDCIKDYIRIQERYLKNIDGRYAESKDYLNHIRSVK